MPQSANNGPPDKASGASQEWTLVQRKKKQTDASGLSPQRKSLGNQTSPGLRGVKQEKTITLYVKNIERGDDEKDDHVKERLKRYVKAKRNQVRLISIYVVHNRFCEDTVGCKLTVPARFKDTLLDAEFWPDDVECREWSTRRIQNKQRTWEKDRYDRRHYGDRDPYRCTDDDYRRQGGREGNSWYPGDEDRYSQRSDTDNNNARRQWGDRYFDNDRDCWDIDGDMKEYRLEYYDRN